MPPLRIYTIGFTKKSAQEFFTKLKASGARRVVDIRLANSSQLAGFAKKDDLCYFLKALCGMEYVHAPDMAPTQEMLDAFKQDKKSWPTYEERFKQLMADRRIEETVPRELLREGCLLCSEPKPDRCHRRLVAEYLREKWGDVEIVHIE